MPGHETAAEAATPSTTSVRQTAGGVRFYLTNEFGLLLLIAFFVCMFAVLTSGFLSAFNQFTLWRVAAVNAMIGFAMMTVIVTGGLNLAVGAIGVCAAMGFGWLVESAVKR